jgi:hypothetical protein
MPDMSMRSDANGQTIGFPCTDGLGIVLTSPDSATPQTINLSTYSHVGLRALGANNAGIAFFATEALALAWIGAGPVSDPFILKPSATDVVWYSVPKGKPFLTVRGQDAALPAVVNAVYPTDF